MSTLLSRSRMAFSRVMASNYPVRSNYRSNFVLDMDMPLLLVMVALLSLGWVMVSSASLDYAAQQTGDAFYFCIHHGAYVLVAVIVGMCILRVPFSHWQRMYTRYLFVAMLLLLLVLVPHVGRRVNGSQRWISLGVMTLQVSEIAKCFVVIFYSGYLVRHREELRHGFKGIIKPLLILVLLGFLLMFEPDFGATVVIGLSVLSLLFLAGAPLRPFLVLAIPVLVLAGALAKMAPYRLARLTAFIDPWDEAVMYKGGYQLTQSLIAIGRGEWLGVGLGHSVQKLFYLPEAHTDFVFSIWAEESGLVGCIVVIALFAVMVWRMLSISRVAAERGENFGALVVAGLALVIAYQAFINMGVASGLLPTKGLTLPFISYGGSSLMLSVVMAAIALRLSFENRQADRPHVVPR